MSFRRVNRSKKVPGVKLRPVPDTIHKAPTPEPTWSHNPGLDSDEETSHADLCPRPFKRFVLCATGINDKTSLFKLALELGAQSLSDLTDRVTHLIAEGPGSAKYRCALENRIPIMHPSWIIESHKIWLRGDDVDVARSIEEHRLPPFTGVVLCLSGIEDVSKRMEINRKLTKAGGTYVKQLERPVKVTHLLCGNESDGETEKVRYAQKFNQMGEARIHVVWEDWFWDSLNFGGRFDEEAYKVSNPRPAPRVLPEHSTLPPASSSAGEDEGLSSEIQNAQTSVVRGNTSVHPQAAHDEEEIASGKRVPAMTLHLWESILKPRGFEVQGGRLVRSPSKSQAAASTKASALAQRRAGSPSRPSKRGSMKALDDDGDGPARVSALSTLQRSRSFAPAAKDVSTPVGRTRQPFQRGAAVSRTSSFFQRPVGSVEGAGGISSDIPIASTSALAGSSQVAGPEDNLAGTEVSEAAKVIFKGLRFRALGEARCASVKEAIEECGGKWVSMDDDDNVDFIVVRLISGSNIFRRETDEEERAKYRTECWLERCIFEERVCEPDEHITFTPLKVEPPIPGADDILLSVSGLGPVELCTIRRLLRALGIELATHFSLRSTHLLCPSGTGPKADKAREWGTPIVDMDWLAAIANTGEIPPVNAPARVGEDGPVLDLPVGAHSREPDEIMASQPPPPLSFKSKSRSKGKEKEKAGEKMVDITNAEKPQAKSQQSLSYYDPGLDEVRPGQADQLEVDIDAAGADGDAFGAPCGLLDESEPAPSLSPPPVRTQPSSSSAAPLESIPSRVYEERVPSSESPSPMRLPGQASSSPGTPVHLPIRREATTVIQDRITSLLGKRRSDDSEGGAGGGAKVQAYESRGKRVRPLQRTRSNVSNASGVHTPAKDGRATPVRSPALALGVGASPASRPQSPFLPQEEGGFSTGKRRKPVSSASASHDEADQSLVVEDSSLHVAYADPRQNGELDRLKLLFHSGDGEGGKKELWELEIEKEMTLPQLSDLGSAGSGSGRKAGRGRRGRGRRGAKA